MLYWLLLYFKPDYGTNVINIRIYTVYTEIVCEHTLLLTPIYSIISSRNITFDLRPYDLRSLSQEHN
jgi:hypothetical protein